MQRHPGCRYNVRMTLPLNAGQIAERSFAIGQGVRVEVIDSIPSTNTELRARIPGLSAPMLLAAEVQTAGRGRAGRHWHSAPGDSLCFSLAWPFRGPIARLSGLSLAVGVAIAETLRVLGWPVQLKWPNDLLLDGGKLGGVLIETAHQSGESSPVLWAVIGVGLNVRTNPARDSLPGVAAAALLPAAQTGHDTGTVDDAMNRNHLLAALTDGLSAALTEFDHDGLSLFTGRWQSLHAHQGQPVCIVEQDEVLQQGIARGIDEMGCLLLDTRAGRIAVLAGDISLRKQTPPGTSHAFAD